MPNDIPEYKPTIDERLEAIVQSLELLAHEVERLDARERNAREALLAGIAAYLRVIQTKESK